MLIVRAKLRRMFVEGSHLVNELKMSADSKWWSSFPSAAKVLRLGFHDCFRYADGSGGCDGCLNWDGVGHRYRAEELGKGMIDNSDRADGAHNGLLYTAQILDVIYTDRHFPLRTPSLPVSLQQSGKSRADLWAFAVIEAVVYSAMLNNVGCQSSEALRDIGLDECHPRVNKSDCFVELPRPFKFQTGRRDCITTGKPSTELQCPSFMTAKQELHANPAWNGAKVVDFFEREFNFTGQETVAIMGAHTLGRVHVETTLYRYSFKVRSASLFNNGYYRNLVKKEDWFYDCFYLGKPCANSTIGNSSGQPPIARWLPHVRGDTRLGGPVQWLQQKLACPTCEEMKMHNKKGEMYQRCCEGVARGSCKEGCETWRFVIGNDETMLNSDAGLYWNFDLDSDGFPTGCNGLKNFNPAGWGPIDPEKGFANWANTWPTVDAGPQNTWPTVDEYLRIEPQCAFNTMTAPNGSKPLHQVVEDFANDQNKWLEDFMPALEKMLRNGYSDNDLKMAPPNGMTGYHCASQSHVPLAKRSYQCTQEEVL
jgi:hypothetical protein